MAVVSGSRMTPARVRLVRAASIAGLAVLVAVWLSQRLLAGAGKAPTLLGEAAYLLPFLLATVGSLLAFARARGFELRFWGLLALATGLWFASELYFSAYVLFVDFQGPPVPSALQLLHAGAVAVLLAMLVSVANFGTSAPLLRLRYFAGALAGLVGIYIVSYDVFVAPRLEDVSQLSTAAIAISAVYPVLGVAIVCGTFGVAFGWRVPRWREWQRFAAVALVLTALGLAAMPWWISGMMTSARWPMAVTEVGLSLGPYLFFLAAVFRLTSSDDSDSLASRPRLENPPLWLHVSYPIALSLAVPLFGYHAGAYEGTPRSGVILTADVVLAATLLVRSWLSALELQQGRSMSSTDAVTGLKDERALKSDLEADVAEAVRWGGEVALIALDIDDLTRVNELFGHGAGDSVLRGVAEVLRADCEDSCRLYRAGSDEFVVIAPGESPSSTVLLAENLARHVERDVGYGDLPTTVSAGATTLSVSSSADSMIRDGFSALQAAKIRQRGSVALWDPEAPRMQPPEERLELARKEAYRATVRALAAAVDARDPASREHSRRVGVLARDLAGELGATAAQATAIETAGYVHDIGKLALPDELLWKHGEIDEDDMARLREHVEIGERILRSTELGFILPWVRAHHERWDGAGYPDGLAGSEIPLEARILAVCDAYDAMTSGISAPGALTAVEALAEIEANAGTQFDPKVAGAFVAIAPR